ncbi:TPA: SDR family NAD(P)-dependent oxidoreductase [Kluyvera ascorbata]|uniref:SDR family NAD(P)-dependent oxidoreductase n=1 Tax=Enterobacteriaceae TaxID=543 RepID=UPI00165E1E13|nr:MULTISPECIES: SDR family NAD(P)-dependent oxidoreductase [Enterobacteriaceae]MEB8610309.1 SDR family NAD(P)-dependent oxidoreductase [Cronobacter sakazakii]WNU05730.1 SDR family NAD(P)-dependent oxidoreductase [Citrobacter freundii]HAT7516936.1 SDR family NAD(P)-dependent oxidoreductase [Kluyvera ascorbata]
MHNTSGKHIHPRRAILLLFYFLFVLSLALSSARAATTDPASDPQVWFVTGSNRGMGLEIARSALAAGDRVVATSRHPDQVRAALGAYGDRLLALPLDITSEDQARSAVSEAVRHFGRIDVLVNNAGYGQLGWFENTSVKLVRRQFETNLFGTMNVTREVLPVMRKQKSGHIFTTSSTAGLIAGEGSSVYSSSKYAVEGWMEGLRAEVTPLGIKTTLIEPGFFRTDFLDKSSVSFGDSDLPDYHARSEAFREWHAKMNHRQIGDPARLGAAVVTLSRMPSPPQRFVAGSDATKLILTKLDAVQQELRQHRALSASTDGNWEAFR